jgi:hypothetical protein
MADPQGLFAALEELYRLTRTGMASFERRGLA